MIVTARPRDLGGFSVRRLLPSAGVRMVGPFIFLDHMGPAQFAAGQGINVRPHPHINLATVTYLFSGQIHHRDSLGSDQLIEPGAINWMTAGRGIVHSERAPQAGSGGRMEGLQCWVALPEEAEEIQPSFAHHPKDTLPEFEAGGVHLKLLLGSALGYKSPVEVHSNLFYLDAKAPAGKSLVWPQDVRDEAALYVVEGRIQVGEQIIEAQSLVTGDISFTSLEDAQVMILGGEPVGPRFIYWNFVSSSKERLEEAKADWFLGPRKKSARFQPIPGDDQEFIPLPREGIS